MKTAELTGPALSWAVAKCKGVDIQIDAELPRHPRIIFKPEEGNTGGRVGETYDEYSPPTDWIQGGPIIERERINLTVDTSGEQAWNAWPDFGMSDEFCAFGPTPLIAAMRCFVASKLGDEVEIPKELT